MAHIKKNTMPTAWPIPRKGHTFVAKPSHATKKGISILFILRDILKIAKTRKEAKYMMFTGSVQINNKIRKDENFPVQVFDTISLEKSKEYYRLEIVNKKLSLKEISKEEARRKVVKIAGKKVIGKNKIQMNLDDGGNIITKEKFSVGDSIVLDTQENKIVKVLPLKSGSNIEVIAGKHAGEKGTLTGFEELVRGKNYTIKLKSGTVNLPFKTILVIE